MSTPAGGVVVPVRLDRPSSPHAEAHADISGTDHIDASVVGSLAPAQVIVLGYWPVPDQSSPQQLRDQFGDEARTSLDAVKQPLDENDFAVKSELSFTKDRDHLIDRVVNKHGCTSVLLPGTIRTTPPESVLVLLRSDSHIEQMVETLSTLFGDSDMHLLLFHAVESGDDTDAVEYMLHGVADRLADRGVDPDRIQWKQSDEGARVDTIVSEVSNHDLVVLGESKPSVRERIFGPIQSGIADRTDRPSLTIRPRS